VQHHTFKDGPPLKTVKVVLNSACQVYSKNDTQAIEKVFAELKRVLAKETEVYLYNFGAELENAARVALASGSASDT
jgi:nucleoid DNA-binding protein